MRRRTGNRGHVSQADIAIVVRVEIVENPGDSVLFDRCPFFDTSTERNHDTAEVLVKCSGVGQFFGISGLNHRSVKY